MVSEQSVDELRLSLHGLRYRDGGLRELARRAGVSYSWLSKFVTGRTRNEKIANLRRISRVLPPTARPPRHEARYESVGNVPPRLNDQAPS